MNLGKLWLLLKTSAKGYMAISSPRLGAALSYYAVFAISPLLLIVVFIGSLWFSKQSVRQEVFAYLSNTLGDKAAATLQHSLAASAPTKQGLLASGIAIVMLLLTATGLFLELQGALNIIFRVEAKSGRGIKGFLLARLLSFAMVIGIGLLLLATMIASAALAVLGKYALQHAPGMHVVLTILEELLSIGIVTVLFAMIFKLLPDVRIAWRDVWIGALVTALLFTLGKSLLAWYLSRNSTVSAYGAAGSLVLLLLWVYYSAQVLFFGAEITENFANIFGTPIQPKHYAQWTVATAANPDPAGCHKPESPPNAGNAPDTPGEPHELPHRKAA